MPSVEAKEFEKFSMSYWYVFIWSREVIPVQTMSEKSNAIVLKFSPMLVRMSLQRLSCYRVKVNPWENRQINPVSKPTLDETLGVCQTHWANHFLIRMYRCLEHILSTVHSNWVWRF